MTGSEIQLSVWRSWDSASLTLAGVIYGVVVAIAAAVIPLGQWWARLLFATAALALLALGLLAFRDAVIRAMKWMLERGKPQPPAA